MKESWLDTTTPQGKLMFTLLEGISQSERDLIAQRTKKGLVAARNRGRIGGRKQKLDCKKKKAVYDLYLQKKLTLLEICNMFDITKPTLYKIVEEVGQMNK